MKWHGFSSYECTWEPKHLLEWTIHESDNPTTKLSENLIQEVSDTILTAFQQGLHRRTGPHFYLEQRHDVFHLLPRLENCLYCKCDLSLLIGISLFFGSRGRTKNKIFRLSETSPEMDQKTL